MNAHEYHIAVSTHDERMLQRELDLIPSNINRAGKLYRKRVQEAKLKILNRKTYGHRLHSRQRLEMAK